MYLAGKYINSNLSINSPSGELIQNVITSDFNYDGKMDVLLITTDDPNADYENKKFFMNIYFGKGLLEIGICNLLII